MILSDFNALSADFLSDLRKAQIAEANSLLRTVLSGIRFEQVLFQKPSVSLQCSSDKRAIRLTRVGFQMKLKSI
jgi:hypothetical protein